MRNFENPEGRQTLKHQRLKRGLLTAGIGACLAISVATSGHDNHYAANQEKKAFANLSPMRESRNGNQLMLQRNISFAEESLDIMCTPKQDDEKLAERLTKMNVRIETDSGIGSGTIIQSSDSKSVVLTNRHVVDGATSVEIQNEGIKLEPDKIFFAPGGLDLALIEVSGNLGPAAQISHDKPNRGAGVLLAGSPAGLNDVVTWGHVSGFLKMDEKVAFEAIQTDAAGNPGNSGGGLFDGKGRLIGVFEFKIRIDPLQLGEGLGFAMPITLLDQYPIATWKEAIPPSGWHEGLTETPKK